jgi:NAD(P)-dependent dehydrogenase (short-subunit alcohol dehydrogenase family)
MFGPREVTEDGHEKTLQVNHLSGFLLTSLLRAPLEAALGVVINTASQAHLSAPLDLDDLESQRRYGAFRAYGTSKLMNVLHAMEINRRFTGVSAVSFHPGALSTQVARNGGPALRWLFRSLPGRLLFGPASKGGDRLAWFACHQPGSEWTPGEYYVGSRPGRKSAHATADNARRVWEASERLVGV